MRARRLDRYLTEGTHSYAEALSYFPEARSYHAIGPDSYLEHIHRAKKAVDIPIIASLNGVSTGGWVNFAKQIEGAGADALELNVYFLPTNMEMSGAEVEQGYFDLLRDIKKEISIPVALKLSPIFQCNCQYDESAWLIMARMDWCCLIASTNLISTGKSGNHPSSCAEQ